jgi:hypothetical protein
VIDFRYHLVSIVSIFMALAVGIVLGAGPLEGDIGTRLTEQMTALRAEKAQLRSDLVTANKAAAARDTFSSVVAPAIIRGRLAGRTVALVVAPGADADLVKTTTASLVLAGARVGSTVTLTDAWADPSKGSARNTVTSSLPTGTASVGNSSPDKVAGAELAGAILGGTDRLTDRLTPSASAVLAGLEAGDLVTVSPDQVVPSSSIVFLSGPVTDSTPQDIAARLAVYVQLVGALDSAGSGIVVASKSNTVDPNQSTDLVAAVRKDPGAVKVASTTDDADLSMGQSTLVLALEQQYAGSSGQYGLAADAKAIVPDGAVK